MIVQPDLFMRNDQPILGEDYVDLSQITFDIEPTSRREQAQKLQLEYLRGLPKGLFSVYKTGGYHPLVDQYPDPIYPYIWNNEKDRLLPMMTSLPYPMVNLPSRYITNTEYRSKKVGSVLTLVHRLLGYCFLPNDEPNVKKNLDHINEDKYDYRLENLQWVTASENMAKRSKHKGWKNAK